MSFTINRNIDSDALSNRIKFNEQYGAKNINDWIFQILRLNPGASVMELGCGTGKQTLEVAQSVGKKGRVYAIDVSSTSLDKLSTAASLVELSQQITPICSEFNNLSALKAHHCDAVLSVYALYYAQSPNSLIKTIYSLLNSKGKFFFCGPSRQSNLQLKTIIADLTGEPIKLETTASIFMEEVGQKLTEKYFGNIKLYYFNNPIRFSSPGHVYTFWESHNLYDASLDLEFKRVIEKYFKTRSIFEITKQTIGVYSVKM